MFLLAGSAQAADCGSGTEADGGSAKRSRVAILLTDNSLLRSLERRHPFDAASDPYAAAARHFAIASPRRAMPAEGAIARRLDRERNASLRSIQRAARPGIQQSDRIARRVESLGGRIIDAIPLPNEIVATVPVSCIGRMRDWTDVTSVIPTGMPVPMSGVFDGSEVWRLAGLAGNGTSADGTGGPDFILWDTGTRVSHQAFRSRMPGDSPDGPGSGSSRVVSPPGRADFGGSTHGNAIAAIVGATDLSEITTAASPPTPSTWKYNAGQAYAIDKLYDDWQAVSSARWTLGLPAGGEPGVADLPEVLNFSAGIYEDSVDANMAWEFMDAIPSQFGIAEAVSAGNCGINPSIYTGCVGGPGESKHRVSTPGNLPNPITVGGMLHIDPYDVSAWAIWPNSSPGPTFGGRKKPDLLALPEAMAGGPSTLNNSSYGNPGQGTSFAAPQVASGALLLASTGVYSPLAQKAILINTATPLQGQTYWTPTTGWGALNLGGTLNSDGSHQTDGAFQHRGHYASDSVTSSGENGVRFFRQDGVAAGDRTTLVWNRRTATYDAANNPASFATTNLDLFQVDVTTGATTATGGVDAEDNVDTNPTVSAANPIPGNGADGVDNVEQTRSTATGTEIFKVKSQSAVAGTDAEPFALAGSHPIAALETPLPEVSLARSPAVAGPGQTVTYTATITNPSNDLTLNGASVTLNVPVGVVIQSGTATQSIGALATNGTIVKTWVVKGSVDGDQAVSAKVLGVAYDEPFGGSDAASFAVDGTPPAVDISAAGPYSNNATVPIAWSGSDPGTGIDHFDVDLARNGGAFGPLLTNTTATSTAVSGSEGEHLSLRVRAADGAGNVSSWTTHDVTIDAVPVEIKVGAPTIAHGAITIPVSVLNAGSPITASYSFSPAAAGPIVPLTTTTVSFKNASAATAHPILLVSANDGLGRHASYFVKYTVPAALRTAALTFVPHKRDGAFTVIRGSTAKSLIGIVSIVVKQSGRRTAKRSARIRDGRFSARFRLAPGKNVVTARFSGNDEFAAATVKRSIRVR
ncbi:MAG: hypothetical protein ACRDKI_05710 [Solirubrobacterales bacterium]